MLMTSKYGLHFDKIILPFRGLIPPSPSHTFGGEPDTVTYQKRSRYQISQGFLPPTEMCDPQFIVDHNPMTIKEIKL